MPVTLQTSTNPPRGWTQQPVADSRELLNAANDRPDQRAGSIIQSSFDDVPDMYLCANKNGFVNAAYHAYSDHHHLRIRPEDVWFFVLTQLSFYINANAEKLREHFIAHEGTSELVISLAGDCGITDLGDVARRMTDAIHEHLVDKDLQQWILPDFTITEKDDVTTAAVIMMGSMQSYFTYVARIGCGIPSVTLLGDRRD